MYLHPDYHLKMHHQMLKEVESRRRLPTPPRLRRLRIRRR